MPKNPDRGEVWLVDLGLAAKVPGGRFIALPSFHKTIRVWDANDENG